jgi:hypothetical protein
VGRTAGKRPKTTYPTSKNILVFVRGHVPPTVIRSYGDKSSLKSSLHSGSASTIHRTVAIPAESSSLPCPGFSFEGLFGRGYISIPNHEREQVTHKADVAGLRWFNSEEKSSVISMSCLEKSPSYQEPAQPCGNCLKVLELSNFKDTLCRETHKSSRKVFTPWRSSNAKMISTDEDHKTTNVSWTAAHFIPLSLTMPLGGNLAFTPYR